MVVSLAIVTVVSFVHCIQLTSVDNSLAYFSTFARAWEFGLGGLLAMVAVRVGRERLRAVTSWVGLVLIVVPIVTFHDVEAFPGLVGAHPGGRHARRDLGGHSGPGVVADAHRRAAARAVDR